MIINTDDIKYLLSTKLCATISNYTCVENMDSIEDLGRIISVFSKHILYSRTPDEFIYCTEDSLNNKIIRFYYSIVYVQAVGWPEAEEVIRRYRFQKRVYEEMTNIKI